MRLRALLLLLEHGFKPDDLTSRFQGVYNRAFNGENTMTTPAPTNAPAPAPAPAATPAATPSLWARVIAYAQANPFGFGLGVIAVAVIVLALVL